LSFTVDITYCSNRRCDSLAITQIRFGLRKRRYWIRTTFALLLACGFAVDYTITQTALLDSHNCCLIMDLFDAGMPKEDDLFVADDDALVIADILDVQ
jgi:hypothetical protein